MKAALVGGDDYVVHDWDSDQLADAHENGRRREVVRARRGVAGRVVVTENDKAGAGGERCPHDSPGFERATALSAYRSNMRARDSVRGVNEQAREVFPVGHADERMQRPRGKRRAVDGLLCDAERTARLNEPYLIDGYGMGRALRSSRHGQGQSRWSLPAEFDMNHKGFIVSASSKDGDEPMPRVDLRVPFDERDEAKRLGARWDADAKVWYVPDGLDPAPFDEWLPEPIDTTVNIRCNRFFIAEGMQKCWACEKNTRVFAFLLPQGHDALQPEGEYFEGQWLRHEHEVMLWQVTWLCGAAGAAMSALTDRYFIATSTHDDGPATKFFSHCEHCGIKQADGGPFNHEHALESWN